MIRFLDSFDHYASADFGLKYTYKNGSNLTIITPGRFGNCAQFFDDSSNFCYLVLNDDDEWIMGFALLPSQLNTNSFVLFRDIGANVTHVDLGLDSSGRLSIRRNGTELGAGTTVLNTLVWYYVEVKFKVHDTTGTVQVRLNGVDEINLTGQDTRNGSSAIVNQFYWRGIGGVGTGNWKMDDLYILDLVDSGVSGKPNNALLGDIRVEALFPNGNGNSSQLDGSDGNQTDNYLLVDETTAGPDEDTTYVESKDVGDKDTYTFTNLSAVVAGSIFGLQILPHTRKTEAGSRTVASIARHSGTEVDSSQYGLSTSYQYFRDVRESKPGGGGWALSDVNGAEFGVKVSA